MKAKITLSIFFLTTAFKIFAQPTLTAATSTPVIGNKVVTFSNAQFNAGNAGAAQIWDFSAQTFISADTQIFENCNATNLCSSFPGTTAVAREVNSSGTNYAYYIAGSTALSFNGVNENGTLLYYNNPEDLYRFPFTYGNSFVDSWSTTFVSSGDTYYRTGIDSVSADGYGTLKTPAGTFENVLRLKRISTFRDSTFQAGLPIIVNYKQMGYNWNSTSFSNYLYNTVSLTTTLAGGSPSTSSSSAYVLAPSTSPSGVANIENNFRWKIFPNPAHDEVQISLNLSSKADVDISLADFTGRIVYHAPPNSHYIVGENKLTISTSGISVGIYIMHIKVGNSLANDKLILQ